MPFLSLKCFSLFYARSASRMRRERSFADDDVRHPPAEVDAARELVERLERRERVLAAMPRPPGNWPEVSRGPIAHIPVTGRIHFFALVLVSFLQKAPWTSRTSTALFFFSCRAALNRYVCPLRFGAFMSPRIRE